MQPSLFQAVRTALPNSTCNGTLAILPYAALNLRHAHDMDTYSYVINIYMYIFFKRTTTSSLQEEGS
jgi:hypothetical protein